MNKEAIKKWIEENRSFYFANCNDDLSKLVHDCITELSQDKWVSVDVSKKCEYEGCEGMSETIVYDREENKFLHTCHDHSCLVVEKDSPEYWHTCPNCGLDQGIN